jgi:hypothetical protein
LNDEESGLMTNEVYNITNMTTYAPDMYVISEHDVATGSYAWHNVSGGVCSTTRARRAHSATTADSTTK